MTVTALPLVDIEPLLQRTEVADVAAQLDDACRRFGFVRITGHGIPLDELDELRRLAGEFFAQPDAVKADIAMERGERAWRGWFPVGAELTSGRADGKEGLYFGEELPVDHPSVVAGLPLHGPNLFPGTPSGLGPAVLAWMDEMTALGQTILGAIAVALGLEGDWFARHVTARPTTLFRIFHYPPGFDTGDQWGVREHTDYGLLTILAQDGTPGLEVHGPDGWIEVPPSPEILVVNLGDMLERMTRGRYRSTPHRVRNTSGTGRLSMPFFLDPSWDAEPTPIDTVADGHVADGHLADGRPRWDGADVHAWQGRYGDYLTEKVAKVFPRLMA